MKTKWQNTDEQSLFPTPQLRTKDGRYCTKEQFRREKVYGENKRLKDDCEKYRRAWLAASSKAARLERKLQQFQKWTETNAHLSDA